MKKNVRISAAQLSTVIEGASFEEKQRKNLGQILEMLKLAGERTSDLVLFGEYANLHHRTWSDDKTEYVSDPIPGAFTIAVAEGGGATPSASQSKVAILASVFK